MSDRYAQRQTRRPPRKLHNLNKLSLDEVGLTRPVVVILGLLTLLPVAGLIVSGYYAGQSHYQTRSLGRLLFSIAVILHAIYTCVICPLLLYVGTRQFL